MDSLLVTALLFSVCLAISCQAMGEFQCEFKSDGVFENGEQSLLTLKHLPFTHFDDCEDALKNGFTKSGIYRIKPKASFRPFPVWCDMELQGGGWIVIQARFDGLVDFFTTWTEYRNGFGSVDSEHWLGNNFIRQITQNNDYELIFELTGYEANEYASAKYSPFRIGSEDEKYKLEIGTFTGEGEIVDQFTYHNGSMFTTKDSDNDVWKEQNCADRMQAGWWYKSCNLVNVNGVWMSKGRSIATRGELSSNNEIGITWAGVFQLRRQYVYSLKSVEMKVRKRRQ